jgi:hypothetical protein
VWLHSAPLYERTFPLSKEQKEELEHRVNYVRSLDGSDKNVNREVIEFYEALFGRLPNLIICL